MRPPDPGCRALRGRPANLKPGAKPTMRRSKRVQVRIPVVVTGTLPGGNPFTEETCVVTVSKFGARLKTRHPLSPGMEIRVRPAAGTLDAVFMVVWADRGTGGLGEVGIQCVKHSNLFGVAFPD
jgi:PilZ domain